MAVAKPEISIRNVIEPFLQKSALVLQPLVEVDSIRMLVELALLGDRVSVMTPIGVQNEIHSGALLFRPLEDVGLPTNRFGLMLRAGVSLHFAPAVNVSRVAPRRCVPTSLHRTATVATPCPSSRPIAPPPGGVASVSTDFSGFDVEVCDLAPSQSRSSVCPVSAESKTRAKPIPQDLIDRNPPSASMNVWHEVSSSARMNSFGLCARAMSPGPHMIEGMPAFW